MRAETLSNETCLQQSPLEGLYWKTNLPAEIERSTEHAMAYRKLEEIARDVGMTRDESKLAEHWR